MFWILLTFVATTGIFVGLLGLACWWVARRLQGHPEAVQALAEHVLMPLLRKGRDDAEEKKPGPRNTGCGE